jgi:hypothetical protein
MPSGRVIFCIGKIYDSMPDIYPVNQRLESFPDTLMFFNERLESLTFVSSLSGKDTCLSDKVTCLLSKVTCLLRKVTCLLRKDSNLSGKVTCLLRKDSCLLRKDS